MLGCQSGPGKTPGYSPGGICSAVSGDGGSGGVLSHSYRGRGSGDNVWRLGGVVEGSGRRSVMSGVPTAVGREGVGE